MEKININIKDKRLEQVGLYYENIVRISSLQDKNICIGTVTYATCSDRHDSFLFADVSSFVNDKDIIFIQIENILIHEGYRNMGIGSQVIKHLCETFTRQFKNCIILCNAYTHKEVYSYTDFLEKNDDIVNRVSGFLEKNGFINVNDVFGDYEYNCAHIYRNGTSQRYIFENPEFQKLKETGKNRDNEKSTE